MNELALFAGAGGGILAGKLLGWRTVCAVERSAYAAQVLAQRQNDGILESFPIWSDVCSFDGRPWRGIVDVISGGFPCQDISVAGKGAGITGARSGLWKEFARIIGEVRPRYVFVENSPRLRKLGLDVVIGDLAKLGYDTEWDVISAEDLGANHQRKRMWIVAYTNSEQLQRGWCQRSIERPARLCNGTGGHKIKCVSAAATRWWAVEPDVGRVAHGVANRVDRISALGNGQVPIVAATAFESLSELW